MPNARPAALCVLVADDDADMRLYLGGCLRAFGVTHVLEAADGLAALRLAHEPAVALVVTDFVMTGLDGEALCCALRADAATAAIPLLLVTGEAQFAALSAPGATRAPPCADGFLAKPFNAASLRAHVGRLIALPA